MPSSGILRKE